MQIMKRLLPEAKAGRPAGGRLGETCQLMDKNRIKGRHGATSWHHTAKSMGLPVEVNAEVAQGSNAFLPGESLPPKRRGEVSRGHRSGRASRGLEYARLAYPPCWTE